MDREKDGSAMAGPSCRCGSRATRRVDGEPHARYCSTCHRVYHYRVTDYGYTALTKEVALALDESRR